MESLSKFLLTRAFILYVHYMTFGEGYVSSHWTRKLNLVKEGNLKVSASGEQSFSGITQILSPAISSFLAFGQLNKPLMAEGGGAVQGFYFISGSKAENFSGDAKWYTQGQSKLSIYMINCNHLGNCIIVLVGIYSEQRLIHTYIYILIAFFFLNHPAFVAGTLYVYRWPVPFHPFPLLAARFMVSEL